MCARGEGFQFPNGFSHNVSINAYSQYLIFQFPNGFSRFVRCKLKPISTSPFNSLTDSHGGLAIALYLLARKIFQLPNGFSRPKNKREEPREQDSFQFPNGFSQSMATLHRG